MCSKAVAAWIAALSHQATTAQQFDTFTGLGFRDSQHEAGFSRA
jgi:hypothetical protein